jgi:hypothetical protein
LPTVSSSVTAPNVESVNFSIDQNSAPANSGAASSAEFNYDNNGNPNAFRIRNGGAFTFGALANGGSVYAPIAGVTYYLWFVLNASAATYQMYMADPNAAIDGDTLGSTATLIWGATTAIGTGTISTFGFRSGASGNTPGAAVNTFDLGQGSNTGTVPQTTLDDIYVDIGAQNLIVPIPEPSTFAMLGLGGSALLLAMRRNRKS